MRDVAGTPPWGWVNGWVNGRSALGHVHDEPVVAIGLLLPTDIYAEVSPRKFPADDP